MLRKVFKLLTLFISAFAFLIYCELSTEPLAKGVSINREIVADCLGNHDRITTQSELDSLNHYFLINDEAWAVGSGLTRFGNKIPSDSLKKYFLISSPLFMNETELRDFHKGIGIRTPFVGIYVLESNKNIMVVKLFRAPGPNIYSGEWQKLQII
ncbi:MAG: hypothetical protein KAJ16_07175 [Calditrichia bacterium]|nr:hypothetical protein [Calditrichia bacterium]